MCKNFIQPVEVKGIVENRKSSVHVCYKEYRNQIAFSMKENYTISTEMWQK